MFKIILQVVSVSTLALATHLAIKKNKWCWLLYQVGAIARTIAYMHVGLYIEVTVQVFFTYMNAKGFLAWREKKKL